LTIATGAHHQFNKLIVASGGHPKLESYQWLAQLGHEIIPPVPSLFTFNMPNENVRTLMGVVAPNASVRIQGSKHISSGPLLITHWGMSGPAVLKLSAWAARELCETGYQFKIQVNWINQANEDIVRSQFARMRQEHPKALLRNRVLFGLPSRLWEFLMQKVQIDSEKSVDSLPQKDVNRLINVILNDIYVVSGKTTFKEEFVTCGGVSLNSVSNQTLQSKVCPGLFFAGEILDIDGVTGGFNFQAAWTTGYIAGALAND
jgi:predicted Rossmann fold flavoprotein